LLRGSAYFDGSGDYLTVPDNATLRFVNNSFTIEGWIYLTSTSAGTIAGQWTAAGGYAWLIYVTGNGNMTFFWNNAGTYSTTSSPFPINQWIHVAIVKNGTSSNNGAIYVNGVLKDALFTIPSINGSSAAISIGYNIDGANFFTGYISDFRFVRGTAVYTGNFTPPTTPLLPAGTSLMYPNTANINTTFALSNTSLLLNFDNAAVRDYSGTSIIEHTGNVRLVSNVSKYGGTALYFDGNPGTQLKISKLAANTTLSTVIGLANLTAEMWVYPLAMAAGTSYSLFTLGSEATNRYTAFIQNGQIKTNYYGAATANIGGNVQPNVWSHVAIVRNGSNINGYVNGVRLPNTETNANFIGNGGANIGADSSGAAVFFGYIDDVRITRGNVRYTANFSVPNQLIIP
jgi:hypothetical protein